MGFNRFVVGSDGGYGFFTNMEPQLQDDFWFVGADGIVIKDHGYQGTGKTHFGSAHNDKTRLLRPIGIIASCSVVIIFLGLLK